MKQKQQREQTSGMKDKVRKIFKTEKPVIGVVHLLPLLGSPSYQENYDEILATVINEVRIYEEEGVDGILIENMHDVPYTNKRIDNLTFAAMSSISSKVREVTAKPLGIQFLSGLVLEQTAIAYISRMQFMRVEAYAYAHIGDEGYMLACAGELLRYRKQIHAEDVMILADIKKKHCSHSITSDLDIRDIARGSVFFKAESLVITGKETGMPPDPNDIMTVRNSVDVPVLCGSGIDSQNILEYLQISDGFIIGSEFKYDKKWYNPVKPGNVERLMKIVNKNRM